MTDNKVSSSSMGPQGTRFFELDDVNKLVADGITDSQSDYADTPVLMGVSENALGQQFALNKAKLEVGRRPNSDIVLDEASVSAMHAQIIHDNGEWKVLNLLSSNGTFVNGEKVSEKVIVPGDRIAFAGAEFVFTLIEDPSGQNNQSRKTMLALVFIALFASFGGMIYFLL